MADLGTILNRLGEVKETSSGYLAHCPAHDDQHKSLSVALSTDGKLLVHCHAGCKPEAIVNALDLKMADLYITDDKLKVTGNKIIKVYDYLDEKGQLIYQSCRKSDKTFIIRRPDGNGSYIYSLGGTPPILYNLPAVIAAVNDHQTIYIVEGEKDADNLNQLGLTATTNPMGAGKWKESYAEYLKGAEVVIIPDNDPPGFKHADQVARALADQAARLKILKLNNLPPKGDVSDWILQGGTADQLVALAKAAPIWTDDDATLSSWPEPEAIKETLLPVEKLPLGIVPDPFKDWISDSAYRLQLPIDFFAVPVIIVCGSLIGASCGIKPKAKDDWLVIPNLWGGVIGRPGMMKTPALNEAVNPLSKLEAAANEEYRQALAAYEADQAMHKAETEAIKVKMAKAAQGKSSESLTDLKDQYQANMAPDQPTWKRYKTNDSTVEKLAELLQDNNKGILLYRDELIGLLKTWEKEGRQADRAFFLEAWNGYGSLTTDRIGRGTIHCDNLCLSILGGVQPAKLLAYLYEAQSDLDNDGLLQRMQLLIYPDELASWQLIDQTPDRIAKERAYSVIKNIDRLEPLNHGAELDPGDQVPSFRFAEDAQSLFNDWLTTLQRKLKTLDDYPVMIEHLNKYRSLMPSLALILHLIDLADQQPPGPVSLESAEKAAAWCDYLESHARRIYGLTWGISQRSAAELAKKLEAKKIENAFTLRELYRKNWYLLNTKEAAKAACDELIEAGWLKMASRPVEGRQDVQFYQINPKIYSGYA